jgi:hypothetical protein
MICTLNPEQVKQCQERSALVKPDRHPLSTGRNVIIDKTNDKDGVDLLGWMGELVVSLATGFALDWQLFHGSDPGYDMAVSDFTIQIKTGCGPSLLFKTLDYFSENADVAVLVEYVGNDRRHPETDPRFVVHGWVTRDDFVIKHRIRDFGRGLGPQPYMHKSKMRPLASLIKRGEYEPVN